MSSRPVLLYDGQCKICLAGMTRIRELDRDGRIEFLDVYSPEVPERFPGLNYADITRELHVIRADGTTQKGAGAVVEIAKVLGGRGGEAVAAAMKLPGAKTAGDLLYALVSEGRRHFR